ncbi:MAG: hypothetical protein [Bacteriophage sp.]|nr:MAG: hypothetical protein [Bacteriophage sp.]
MIDLEIIKKDIVNRVLASSGKRKIQDNTVYGLNLIQDIFILEINQLKEQVAYLNNKIKDSNGHILSLNQKVEKLESGEFVLVPRNLSNELWEVMWKEFELSESMHEAHKAMIEAVEKHNAIP